MGVLPALYFVMYTARKRAPYRPVRREFTTEFAPEIFAEITHAGGSPLEDGDYRVILALGTDGFSARFRVTGGVAAGQAAVQFLAPDVALPRFAPGTEFNVVQGKDIVGKGKVSGHATDTA